METIVKILKNEKKSPARKLADVELHFVGGTLDGLKLVGFSIWERSDRNGLDVTFPSREFTVDGRRRRYALLRAIGDLSAQDRLRDAVLQAHAAEDGREAKSERPESEEDISPVRPVVWQNPAR